MGLGSLYNRIALLSPRIEVMLRKIYWKNVKRLGRFNPNKSAEVAVKHVDFQKIIDWLHEQGVGEGSLLIVHSSYDNLQCTGLQPQEIINRLKDLVGETGTLAMPVIRFYKEEPAAIDKLSTDFSNIICKYHIKRTPVITGLLPSLLLRNKGVVISKHPLNPLCAIGPLADQMMAHNIEGVSPSPHGPNSCWKFCLDHGACVCSIGTDLRHHNTMGHVAEEAFGDWRWSDEEWYNLRTFIIESPGEEPFTQQVKERKPKWGMLHQAEINRYHDFIKDGVVKSKMFDSVLVEFEESQKLIAYLQKKNKKGYPYF